MTTKEFGTPTIVAMMALQWWEKKIGEMFPEVSEREILEKYAEIIGVTPGDESCSELRRRVVRKYCEVKT